jgi:hypothetical protein
MQRKFARRSQWRSAEPFDSIRSEHAILGRHLQNSISSGLTFRYDPERDPSWLTPR